MFVVLDLAHMLTLGVTGGFDHRMASSSREANWPQGGRLAYVVDLRSGGAVPARRQPAGPAPGPALSLDPRRFTAVVTLDAFGSVGVG
jgi:hypothetical protein